jgi:hypothetical protein
LARQHGVVPIPEEDLYDQSDAVKVAIHSQLSKRNSVFLKALIPASPLFNAGLLVEAGTARDIETTINALNVRARIFNSVLNYGGQSTTHVVTLDREHLPPFPPLPPAGNSDAHHVIHTHRWYGPWQ